MAKQKRQPETFDVSEFLRPTDQDMKSALISILGPGGGHASQQAPETQADAGAVPASTYQDDSTPEPIAVPAEDGPRIESAPASNFIIENVDNTGFNKASRPKKISLSRPLKRGLSPVDSSFDVSLYLQTAKATFRLNSSELSIYEIFLKWTHAVGKTQCDATNRKICEASGLIEKSVRRNLKSLRASGLIIQVKFYDPQTRQSPSYEVLLSPLNTTDRP